MARSRESQRSGLVTKAHIDQRQIADQLNVFWLFFREKLPIRCGPDANFPGRRRGRHRLPEPSLTKIAARH